MVDLLLKAHADPMKPNGMNMLPMHDAAVANCAEIVKAFLAAGVPVDARGFDSNPDGPSDSTALILAAQTKAYDVAQVLIEAKADVNAITNVKNGTFRRSALFWAYKSGDQRMVELLEKNGAVKYFFGVINN